MLNSKTLKQTNTLSQHNKEQVLYWMKRDEQFKSSVTVNPLAILNRVDDINIYQIIELSKETDTTIDFHKASAHIFYDILKDYKYHPFEDLGKMVEQKLNKKMTFYDFVHVLDAFVEIYPFHLTVNENAHTIKLQALSILKNETVSYRDMFFNVLFDRKHVNSRVSRAFIGQDGVFVPSSTNAGTITDIKANKSKLKFNNKYDSYFTPNTFRRKRSRDELIDITSFYVDIDYVGDKTKVDDKMIDYLLTTLNNEYLGTKLPTPTFIVDSGCGVHIYWKLKDMCPNWNNKEKYDNLINYWYWVEDKIIKVFEDLEKKVVFDDETYFKIDRKVKDIVRFMRTPNTINQNNGRMCKVIEEHIENAYTIEEIKQDWIVYEEFKPKESPKVRKSNGLYYINGFNKVSRARAIANDFCKLVELRGGEAEGYRERMMWITTMKLTAAGVSKKEVEEAQERLNQAFNNPLSAKEIKNQCKFRKDYTYKNERLIEEFDITREEMKQLSHLISNREKRDRWNKKRNETRYGRVEGSTLTAKQRERQKNIEKAKQLREDGNTIKEIAKIFGKSDKTIKNWLKS